MKTDRKRLIVVASSILGTWLLTLGLFLERDVASSFRVESGEPTAAFENGQEIFVPNTWVYSEHERGLGVPYLLYSVSDRPPYGLVVCFTAHADRDVESISIESIEVEYDDGHTIPAVNSKLPANASFDLDNSGSGGGNRPRRRAYFSFADCLTRRESFRATIVGSYWLDGDKLPYETRVDVTLRDETYLYPGWFAILMRQL